MVDDSGKHPVRKSAPDAADAIFKAMFSQVSLGFPSNWFVAVLSGLLSDPFANLFLAQTPAMYTL